MALAELGKNFWKSDFVLSVEWCFEDLSQRRGTGAARKNWHWEGAQFRGSSKEQGRVGKDLFPMLCWKSGLNPGDQGTVWSNSLLKKINSRAIENESVVSQIQASERKMEVDMNESSGLTWEYCPSPILRPQEKTLKGGLNSKVWYVRLALSPRHTSSFFSANSFLVGLLMVHLPLGKILAFQFCLAVRGDDGDVSKHLLPGGCGKIPVSLTKEMPMWLGLFFPPGIQIWWYVWVCSNHLSVIRNNQSPLSSLLVAGRLSICNWYKVKESSKHPKAEEMQPMNKPERH